MANSDDAPLTPIKLGDITLPNRIIMAPLKEWDDSTFYGGDARGYIDYPFPEKATV